MATAINNQQVWAVRRDGISSTVVHMFASDFYKPEAQPNGYTTFDTFGQAKLACLTELRHAASEASTAVREMVETKMETVKMTRTTPRSEAELNGFLN
jgi:hypothetical protein